jgi:hypothetical protein
MALETIGNVMTVQAQQAEKRAEPKTEAMKPTAVEPANYVDSATLTITNSEKKDQNEQGSS